MSPILEVLIGLIFIYSLFSILVSQFNTFIAQLLRIRARFMFDAVHQLIHDPEITARFMVHPLIKILKKPDVNNTTLPDDDALKNIENNILKKDFSGTEWWSLWLNLPWLKKKELGDTVLGGVDWISKHTFSDVLLSAVQVDDERQLFSVLLDTVNQMPNSEEKTTLTDTVNTVINTGLGLNELINQINDLTDSSYRRKLRKQIHDITVHIGSSAPIKRATADETVAILAGLKQIKDEYLQTTLATIVSTSQSIDETKGKIEEWFDQRMYKLTKEYKSHMRNFSLFIGLLVAIILNIDTVYIASNLWEDPLLRASIADAAQTASIAEMQDQITTADNDANGDAQPTTDDLEEALAAILDTVSNVQSLNIPIGWKWTNLSNPDSTADEQQQQQQLEQQQQDSRYLWNFNPANNDAWFNFWLLKIVGIGATAIALGQGAPFWFGLLGRFTK